MNKTVSIKTLGCKLNQYESALISNNFIDRGWEVKPFGEKVGLVIINTCTVTEKSDKKCRSYIRKGARLSGLGKSIVTGCMAERDRESIELMPEVMAVFGNREKENICGRIITLLDDPKNLSGKNFNDTDKISAPLPIFRTRGYMKIQDGCDGSCTYCIIPEVRGLPVSRNMSEIIEHSKKLISGGCPEIVLTGITIGRYCSEGRDIAGLVDEIIKLDGEYRVRITSIEPSHLTESLLNLLGSDRVCGHIHLPLQSGSDDVLKLMKRPYTTYKYRSVIERVKAFNSDIAIGTDIMIGFPGENEKDFMESIKMIEWAGFAYVHQFTFSSRAGTPAEFLKQGISPGEISRRKKIMRNISAETGLIYRKKFEGRVLPCVLEKKKDASGFKAVSDNYIKIDVADISPDEVRYKKLHNVKLIEACSGKNIGII